VTGAEIANDRQCGGMNIGQGERAVARHGAADTAIAVMKGGRQLPCWEGAGGSLKQDAAEAIQKTAFVGCPIA
jgi:hypothetical protein